MNAYLARQYHLWIYFVLLRIFHDAFLIFVLYLPKLIHSPFLRDDFFILKVGLPPFLWMQLSKTQKPSRVLILSQGMILALNCISQLFFHVICFTPGERSLQFPFMTGLLWSKGPKIFIFFLIPPLLAVMLQILLIVMSKASVEVAKSSEKKERKTKKPEVSQLHAKEEVFWKLTKPLICSLGVFRIYQSHVFILVISSTKTETLLPKTDFWLSNLNNNSSLSEIILCVTAEFKIKIKTLSCKRDQFYTFYTIL